MEAEERLTAAEKLDKKYREENGAADVIPAAVTNNEDDSDEPADLHGADGSPENSLKRKRTPPPEGMSRSAYKKLKRQQQWDAGKVERRAKEKERLRSKKEARRQAIAAGEIAPTKPQTVTVAQKKEKSTLVPVTFVFDCGFDELMTENEIKSLASQITRCYSDNGRAKYRAHLAVSSFNGRLRKRFENVLDGQYKQWKGVDFHEDDLVEVANKARTKMLDERTGGSLEGALMKEGKKEGKKENALEKAEIIYLSAESENTIEHLSPYSTYIIGGLVDRNRHKGICYKKALDRGIKTAKLPIGKFLEMNSRYVLTTNHVNEIMLNWLELGDWGEAFIKVIPKRKGGKLKGGEGNSTPKDSDDNGFEDTLEELDEEEPLHDKAASASNIEQDEGDPSAPSAGAGYRFPPS